MLDALRRRACKFFVGYGLISFFGIIAVLAHVLAAEIFTMPIMLLLAGVGVLAARSIRPFLAALIFFIFQCSVTNAPSIPSYSDYYFTPPFSVIVLPCFAFALICFCVHFFRERSHLAQRIARLPYKGAAAFFCLSLILSGAGSAEWRIESLIFGAISALAIVLLPYILMLGMTDDDRQGAVEYLVTICEVLACVLIAETVNLYAFGDVIQGGEAQKGEVLFGWGIWTTAGMDMAVLIPMLFVGVLSNKRPIFRFILAHLLYACCVLTISRNALLGGTFALAIGVIVLLFSSQSRRVFRRIYLALGLIAALLSPLWVPSVAELLSDFFERGFSDNGRFEMWGYGISRFLDSPIFGKGAFAIETDAFKAEYIFPQMLHNTFVQLAAASGIFGVISYILWQSAALTRLILPLGATRILLSLTIITFILMSLFDSFLFHVQPMFLLSAILAAAEVGECDGE